jgi:aspartyl-tRNA(Asn)/glutamyl-tRNA(Gln) amidotransferase subunit C
MSTQSHPANVDRRGVFANDTVLLLRPEQPVGESMTTPIDEKLVRHIGTLGRIRLSDAEVAQFGKQLADILGSIEKLNELDTDNVEPMAHAVDLRNVLADDILGESLPPAVALANAPERDGDFFKVPKVIGDSQ